MLCVRGRTYVVTVLKAFIGSLMSTLSVWRLNKSRGKCKYIFTIKRLTYLLYILRNCLILIKSQTGLRDLIWFLHLIQSDQITSVQLSPVYINVIWLLCGNDELLSIYRTARPVNRAALKTFNADQQLWCWAESGWRTDVQEMMSSSSAEQSCDVMKWWEEPKGGLRSCIVKPLLLWAHPLSSVSPHLYMITQPSSLSGVLSDRWVLLPLSSPCPLPVLSLSLSSASSPWCSVTMSAAVFAPHGSLK